MNRNHPTVWWWTVHMAEMYLCYIYIHHVPCILLLQYVVVYLSLLRKVSQWLLYSTVTVFQWCIILEIGVYYLWTITDQVRFYSTISVFLSGMHRHTTEHRITVFTSQVWVSKRIKEVKVTKVSTPVYMSVTRTKNDMAHGKCAILFPGLHPASSCLLYHTASNREGAGWGPGNEATLLY